MANVKISALPAATSVAAADVLPIVQSATTKKATFTDVAGAVGGVRVYASAAARNSAITSPTEGMCVYLTDEDTLQIYTGSAWVAIGATKTVSNVSDGLVFVKSQTIGSTVTSVQVTSAFSSTYDNYKIIISGGASSTSTGYLTLQLGSTTANYRFDFISANLASATPASAGSVGATNFPYVGIKSTGLYAAIEIGNPFLAMHTMISCPAGQTGNNLGWLTGVQVDSTSFTDFTIGASSGTITGGTISVYGYRK